MSEWVSEYVGGEVMAAVSRLKDTSRVVMIESESWGVILVSMRARLSEVTVSYLPT